ncbi:MAG: chromosome segregation protein [Firmicutes bacterium ADurb.Bin193]|nr:MAG: chromosome segregation protein [Firmicutes bacterium ADurb.Bin193]
MIIKSLYIEKFGGISDKRIDFNDGLNIIYDENEAGKSTIAEFIKIMLYGMGKSPQNIRDNERVRYMPWGEKIMGGEMTVSHGGKDYTIIRSFGKRKGEDRISVINSLTGEDEPIGDSPGSFFLNIGHEGFEKSLYIKQLSSKIEPDGDDEIMKKLVNLAQSGDEGVSFHRAVKILDAAVKELNGVRPRGKMLLVQDEINHLLTKKTVEANKETTRQELNVKLNTLTQEKARLEAFLPDKSELERLKAEYTRALSNEALKKSASEEKAKADKRRILYWVIGLFVSVVATIAFLFVNPLLLFFGITLSAVFAVLTAKEFSNAKKRKTAPAEALDSERILSKITLLERELENSEKTVTARLIEIAEQIGDMQSRLRSMEIIPASEIDEMIAYHREKYNNYAKTVSELTLARECLQESFDELQRSFGKQLNEETSAILGEITGGRYTGVLIDDEYNMSVRTQSGELQSAQFLSNGTYDQIYFALRMGIVHMLFEDAPIILDEAFVQYDENRLKAVLDFIKKENRQIILFSCHKRERELIGE